MVVAHIKANRLSLETDRRGRARGKIRGFRQQPKCTRPLKCLPLGACDHWLYFDEKRKCYDNELEHTLMLLHGHQKITRIFICRLKKHHMSYKALYNIQYFITLSVVAMLFKAYPTYICFLSDMYMFLKKFQRHILFDNIFYETKYFLQQHTHVFKQHIYFI